MAADRRRLAGKRGSAAGPSGPARRRRSRLPASTHGGPTWPCSAAHELRSPAKRLKNLERGTNKVLAKTWGVRWGPDASSDILRRSARCNKSGRKGAVLQHLSGRAWISAGSLFRRADVGTRSPRLSYSRRAVRTCAGCLTVRCGSPSALGQFTAYGLARAGAAADAARAFSLCPKGFCQTREMRRPGRGLLANDWR